MTGGRPGGTGHRAFRLTAYTHGGLVETRCTCGAGHPTFGACVRAKNIRVGYCRSAAGLDATAEKDNARELDAYAAARRQGVQPAGTHYGQINFAMDQSERQGSAWDASQVGKVIGDA